MKAIKHGQCESSAQKKALALSDTLINELKQADTIVIGMPLYNLTAPSVFHSYIDYILRTGVTFRYTKQGLVGLLDNKSVYILCARVGVFLSDNIHMDTQTPWLKNILGFIGFSSIQFIYAEGLGMGEEVAAEKSSHAKDIISKLFTGEKY